MANRGGRTQLPPGFEEPFPSFGSAFGMMGGMGGGQSLFGSFFQNDPFSTDPFFTRPFEHMDSMFQRMGSMFGGPMLSGFEQQPRQFLQDRPAHTEGRTGPTIEEIPDDAPVDEQAQSSSRRRSGGSQEPIVEHPDDEEETQHRRRSDHHRNHARDHHGANDVASRPAGGAQVFSFSSVQSYSRDGSGPGNYYSKSTTTRMGPDGVADQQTREQDSRSNTDKLKYVRALGSKARSVLRTRKADGEEESLQTLHNLEEEEAATFDDQWQQKAERALPRWYDGSGRALPDQSGGRSSRMALPANSSGGRNTRARGVRQA
ncbi:hypothetical protein CBR_g33932 [Chara braunii]|uniref:Myeloid leukemia factor n=1 Tax=Chara braunii TaxID=69332 RepID=A0A388LHF1_CHABU|nr:hypothetical protein CBR_g33932 [Chara braunii]|eukprot:GBG81754.1 hypothetical protein CBR_g33932 [Chara braunii]